MDMKIIWELPPEPGAEVTHLRIGDVVFERHGNGWRLADMTYTSTWAWSELVGMAADNEDAILDVTP